MSASPNTKNTERAELSISITDELVVVVEGRVEVGGVTMTAPHMTQAAQVRARPLRAALQPQQVRRV